MTLTKTTNQSNQKVNVASIAAAVISISFGLLICGTCLMGDQFMQLVHNYPGIGMTSLFKPTVEAIGWTPMALICGLSMIGLGVYGFVAKTYMDDEDET